MAVGTVWVDHGATAFDPEDGDLTDRIERDASELDTNVPGVYRVTYRVHDSAGCESVATRSCASWRCRDERPVLAAAVPALRPHGGARVRGHALRGYRRRGGVLPGVLPVGLRMDAAARFLAAPWSRARPSLERRSNASASTARRRRHAATPTTRFDALRAFTPMACGFAVKTGAVCGRADAGAFLANETRTALELESAGGASTPSLRRAS